MTTKHELSKARALAQHIQDMRDRWAAAPAWLRETFPYLDEPLFIRHDYEEQRSGASFSVFLEAHPSVLRTHAVEFRPLVSDAERAELRTLLLADLAATQRFIALVQELYARLDFHVTELPPAWRNSEDIKTRAHFLGPKVPFVCIDVTHQPVGDSGNHWTIEHPMDPRDSIHERISAEIESRQRAAGPWAPRSERRVGFWLGSIFLHQNFHEILGNDAYDRIVVRANVLQHLTNLDASWRAVTQRTESPYDPLQALFEGVQTPAWTIQTVLCALTEGHVVVKILRERPLLERLIPEIAAMGGSEL